MTDGWQPCYIQYASGKTNPHMHHEKPHTNFQLRQVPEKPLVDLDRLRITPLFSEILRFLSIFTEIHTNQSRVRGVEVKYTPPNKDR